MADDETFSEADDDPEVAAAAVELATIRTGAVVLTGVAAVAALIWATAVVVNFWNWWDLRDAGGTMTFTTGSIAWNGFRQTLAATLTNTWGYALVAVVAYVGAMVLRGQRMRILVAALADDA